MADLFLKLLNASISASYLVLAVILLRLLLKKAPKWVSPVLWGLVGLRLIFPISIESVLSLVPSAQPIPADIAMARHPAIDSGIPAVNRVVNPVITQSFTPAPAASANPLQIWLWAAGWIWLAGIVLMLLYTLFSYLRLRRRVRTAVRIREGQYQCETVASPFVLGLFRPRIYLPYGLGEQDVFYIVAHEQAHIRRRDHWWKPLGFTLLAVHWFNPLMWLAYILLCRDIELACDEKVIKQLGWEGRADYSQALLTCSVSRRSIAACPLAFGEVGVKARVKSVLSYKKPALWIIIAAVASAIVLAVCFLTNPKKEEIPQDLLGDYRVEWVLYSDASPLPEEETPVGRVFCQVNFDEYLLLRNYPENEAASWTSLGKLEPCGFSNADLEAETRKEDNWRLSSLRYPQTIAAAYSVTEPESGDEYVFFRTKDRKVYLAVRSVQRDAGPYISYFARLQLTQSDHQSSILLEDAAPWGVTLTVEKSSPTGATVLFNESRESGDYVLMGGNDYVLQKEEDGVWTDFTVLSDPVFMKEAYAISNVRRHEIDWAWLYGELPAGHYRIGKTVTQRIYTYPEGDAQQGRYGESAMAWGEFSVANFDEVYFDIGCASPMGAPINFWQSQGSAGIMTGSDFVLQTLENDAWVDLPTLTEPVFDDAAYSIAVEGGIGQQVDWGWLYGALPDGRYRMGKHVWVEGTDQQTTVYAEFTLSMEGKPQLTLEDVLKLAEENRELGWTDFEDYAYVETWGSASLEYMAPLRCGRFYEMDGPLYFIIRGRDPEKPVYHMGLACQEDGKYETLDREGGVDDLLRFFIDLHNKPLAENQTSHWGVTLKLDNVTPTGADMYFDGIIESDIKFLPGDLCRIQRKTADGLWEDMPVLDGSMPEDEQFREENFRCHRISWEKRHGILEPGAYRLCNFMNIQYGWSEKINDYSALTGETMYAEFTIDEPYTAPDDASLTMTAQDAAPDNVVVKFSWQGDALPEAYYRMAGYTVEKQEGDTWKTVYENAPGEPYAESRIDFDWYAQTTAGLFLSWESVGDLPDGVYRIGQEIATSEDLAEARRFMVYAAFEINTRDWENGMMPLRDVPDWYSPEDAERDGYVVARNGECYYEPPTLAQFAEAALRGEPAYVRVASFYSSYSGPMQRYIQDLDFDGEKYTLRWLEDGREKVRTYRYLKVESGQLPTSRTSIQAYSSYVLTNDEGAQWEQIRQANPGHVRGQIEDHFVICCVISNLPVNPDLPGGPVEAVLEFQGEALLAFTDPEPVERLHRFFTKAEYIGFEPKTHSVGVGLDLVITCRDGGTIRIELAPDDNLCRINGEFCQYGTYGVPQVPQLWEYLGIDQWPDVVYENCANAFRENP